MQPLMDFGPPAPAGAGERGLRSIIARIGAGDP